MWEGKKKGCHLWDSGILDVDGGDVTRATDRHSGEKRTVLCLTVQMTGSPSLEGRKGAVIGRMKYIKAGHFEGHIRISEQADLTCDGV